MSSIRGTDYSKWNEHFTGSVGYFDKEAEREEKEMRWIDSNWLANGGLVGYSGNLE